MGRKMCCIYIVYKKGGLSGVFPSFAGKARDIAIWDSYILTPGVISIVFMRHHDSVKKK